MEEDLDSVDSFEQNLKNGRKKRKFQDIDLKIADAVDSRKTKMILEFNNHESVYIKSFAVKSTLEKEKLKEGRWLKKTSF